MRLIANIIFYTTYSTLCCTQHKDDVLTTGATVVSCADAFRGIPGLRISVLTLALAGES